MCRGLTLIARGFTNQPNSATDKQQPKTQTGSRNHVAKADQDLLAPGRPPHLARGDTPLQLHSTYRRSSSRARIPVAAHLREPLQPAPPPLALWTSTSDWDWEGAISTYQDLSCAIPFWINDTGPPALPRALLCCPCCNPALRAMPAQPAENTGFRGMTPVSNRWEPQEAA